jgi:predicted transporter
MGTIDKGILGGFSGKVGNVVGGNWKGIDYMRSKASRRNFKPTQRQLEQQLKFGLAIRFAQTFGGLAEISFGNFAVRKTGINSAVSYILKNAITGLYPAFSIDYANVLISRGDMPNVLAPSVTVGAGSVVTWKWTDNSSVGIARANDQALLAAYCPAFNQCIYTTGSASRSALTDSLNLGSFSGQDVHCWIGFISENGENVAGSLYNGKFTVT